MCPSRSGCRAATTASVSGTSILLSVWQTRERNFVPVGPPSIRIPIAILLSLGFGPSAATALKILTAMHPSFYHPERTKFLSKLPAFPGLSKPNP